MHWKQFPLLLLFSLVGTAAHADTTYNVNLNIGGATANGTITTNGVLGILATNDITGFNLTLASGATSQTIFNQSVAITGSQFTATTDGLFYDLDNTATANVAGFASDFTATGTVLCFTGGGNCPGSLGQGSLIRLDNVLYNGPATGLLQVASAIVPPSVTPEPSSLALLGTGMLGLYGAARRRLA